MFVNTEIDDGTPISSLMSCFTKKMVSNPSFPKISKRVAELKTTEGGQRAVCAVMEAYEQKAREEGRTDGEDRLSQLISILLGKKRYSDIEEITKNVEYRNKLYAEFGIA